jgi:4-hydroxybenzoate polyprenyltransferase
MLRRMTRSTRATWRGHVAIARFDHWLKNVFVLPGVVVALSLEVTRLNQTLVARLLVGLIAVGLVASSNYVLNEVLDAPFDRVHPHKQRRPVPSGIVSVPFAYAQWLVLMIAGLALAFGISARFAAPLAALWIMGCIYNVPPVRTKDVPYVDVLSEAVNNPLRLVAGWYLTGTTALPPTSLVLSYWMVGAYFMTIKRFAEYREIVGTGRSADYRKSFGYYTEERLLVSVMFYGSIAMLFLGAFIVRYRLELVLSFPLLGLIMAHYFALAFKPNSAAQRPEGLYREPTLVAISTLTVTVMVALLFVDLPWLHRVFAPTER